MPTNGLRNKRAFDGSGKDQAHVTVTNEGGRDRNAEIH